MARTSQKISILVDAIWRFFISLRLTFVLLAIIGIGAVVGMSFDQTLTFDQFVEARNESSWSAFILSFFELYDAFHSWWFSLAIYFLALNLIACSIERLPRIYFDYIRPRPYLSGRRFIGLAHREKLVVASLADARALVDDFLATQSGSAKLPHKDGYYFKDRISFGRFGVYVVHIALLIIMFSSIYATQNGVDGHVLIEEGKMARFITARGASGVSYTYDLGFYVGCDDFRLRTFVDNSPMEFESDLFVSLDRNEKLLKKTVRVNEPLSYAGFTFYQSSYRPLISERTVEVEVKFKDADATRHRIKLNEPISLKNGETLVVEKIYDDFAGLGQAVRVAKKSDNDATYFHIFRRFQDYDQVVRNDDFDIRFLDADQLYATGLSIGKVPGIEVIFGGFLLLLVGLYLCFFTTPMRYFARIEKSEGGYTVWLALSGFRMPQVAKEVFHKKLESIRSKNSEMNHA